MFTKKVCLISVQLLIMFVRSWYDKMYLCDPASREENYLQVFPVFFRSHLVYAFILITDLFVCLCVDALQIIDEEETQFMTNCPPAVTESTPRRRTSIQVFWTAPPSGSGCVFLKYVYSNGWSACLAESSPQLKQWKQ